jgi:hypothetical protein
MMSRVREQCNEILEKLGADSLGKEESRRVALMTDDAALVYTMDKMMDRVGGLTERTEELEMSMSQAQDSIDQIRGLLNLG